MCIDYTDINKAYPKDRFPLSRIDQLVDTTSGHHILSFMDAYFGYNQIKMNPADEEATTFQKDKGLYCYRVMPFGLKNAGATYQRLMNKVFKNLIRRTMEVHYNMRLNPANCIFGVASEKFLGFMITHRGIEANPEKIKALRDMMPLKNIKEVQRLNGRITTLSHFLARSGDKYLLFFKYPAKPEASGRLVKWSVELEEFDIHYFPMPDIKSQALTDFVIECTIPVSDIQPSFAFSSKLDVSPWPFVQWGIDIIEPFHIANRQRKFIIYPADYFTKWVEAEPLAKIAKANAKQFLWKNIICRFGIPTRVITDNGTHFTGRIFTSFFKDFHIQLIHTDVAHPQANGQTEVTN
ncbi:uncharacterized protein LOC110106664 [Dendrobium catenatum]|uniref:uncharacterized protein LOC110106664 n=1 Tax=Dendrobium catenatum TaxID=906689 RepID=UPI0009F19B77|nr:uncharacterized protein LOC110106664 [Dendrobium catenatum]